MDAALYNNEDNYNFYAAITSRINELEQIEKEHKELCK